MKKVILVNINSVYISNETLQPANPTEHERLIDQFLGSNKFTFVELYTPIKTFTAKTYKQLNEMVLNFSETNKIWGYHCIEVKN